MEELAKNVTRVRDAVATYCGKYHIAPAFAICDVYQRPSPSYSRGFRFALTGMAQGIELA